MSSRRRAPKRRVLSRVRTGAYPHVMWEHGLSCGHIESRKRRSGSDSVGCSMCLSRIEEEKVGVYVVPDLDQERLRQEQFILGLVKGSDFSVKEMDVQVEDVSGQAQVRTIRLFLERKR